MTLQDMNTSTPDHGEPWSEQSPPHPITKDKGVYWLNPTQFNRAVVCVNACAGMVDPAKEITELRKELAHQTDMACQAHVCGGARIEELQKENAAMREAIREVSRQLEFALDMWRQHHNNSGNERPTDLKSLQTIEGERWNEGRVTLAKLQPFLK